jgi:2-oxoglutarate ferredoxin oxidoreductase subunit beta
MSPTTAVDKSDQEEDVQFDEKAYESGGDARLCPGCGHNPITSALKQAAYELQIPPEELNVVGGIGCSGKTIAEVESYAIHTLHGCATPVAIGANLANPDQTTAVISGDGDSWAIGAGKAVALMRTNLDMVYICENNGTYGLTKGQFSPTTEEDSPNKYGQTSGIPPVDGVNIALSSGATFVAKGFSANRQLLVEQIKAGILHDGLAYIDVMSPCVKFNDHDGSHHSYKYGAQHQEQLPDFSMVNVEEYYPDEEEMDTDKLTVENFGQRFRLQFENIEEHPEYDPTDKLNAQNLWNKKREQGKIPLGLLYVNEDRAPHHERYYDEGDTHLVDQDPENMRPSEDEFDEILDQYS